MEASVRDSLISAITDRSTVIEDVHLFHHWIVIKAGRYEMSTRFKATPGLTEDSNDTWLGDLIGRIAADVAEEYLASVDVLRVAVGMVCLKCVITPPIECYEDSAVNHFAELTRTRPTCFLGHFQEAAAWRDEGRPLTIVELRPCEGDIRWEDSREILAKAELVFMTGLTLVNGTFGEVVRRTPRALCRVIMGPTVPLTPALFTLGLHWAGTSQIIDVQKTLRYFGMGGGSVRYAPQGALRKVNIGALTTNPAGVRAWNG